MPGIKDVVLRTFSGWEFLPFEMTILKSAGSIMSNFRVYPLAVGMLLAFGMSLFAGSPAWAQQPAEKRSVLKKLQQLKENDRINELPPPARRQLTGDGQRTGLRRLAMSGRQAILKTGLARRRSTTAVIRQKSPTNSCTTS